MQFTTHSSQLKATFVSLLLLLLGIFTPFFLASLQSNALINISDTTFSIVMIMSNTIGASALISGFIFAYASLHSKK